MLPYLGRTDHERRLVLTGIALFFLANEVWLVAAIGLLAGAFPELEAVIVHELYAPFTLLLLGWVVRDTGLWLRGRVDRRSWRVTADGAVIAASWGMALGWGALLGAVLGGREAGSLIGMAAAAVLFGLHGLAFSSLRLTGALRRRAAIGLPFLFTSAAMTAVGVLAGVRLDPRRPGGGRRVPGLPPAADAGGAAGADGGAGVDVVDVPAPRPGPRTCDRWPPRGRGLAEAATPRPQGRSYSGHAEFSMTSTKSPRTNPGTKWASTSALTLPNVVSGRSLIPSVNAARIRLKSGRGWASTTAARSSSETAW